MSEDAVSLIHFDKLSVHDRLAEPVSIAIPVPRGMVGEPEKLTIRDGNGEIPRQVHTTSTWDDGSIKWVLCHAEVDLPGNAPHDLRFDFAGGSPPNPSQQLEVTDGSSEVWVDTGPLRFAVSKTDGKLFGALALDDKELLVDAIGGFEIQEDGGERFSTGGQTVDEVTVVHEGPIRAEIEVAGSHRSGSSKRLDYVIRYVAWAGKPWVEVDYQFVNRERSGDVTLSEITLGIKPDTSSAPRMALGEGYYQTRVTEGPAEFLIDQETILYQAVEHVVETFYGDFWVDWCDDRGGVAVTQFQAHQNFPKRLAVDSDGIDIDVFPAGQPPVRILQGVAKTHRFLFHFHDASTSHEDVLVRSLQFQMPDVGILPESVYRESGVWENLFPEKLSIPIESALIDKADNRARGLGMLHWGDGPDAGYTQQGRGKGELVWTNNEYDFPHAMYLFFAKTGERRFRDIATVAAQHWIDVDFCHYSDDPLKMGGQPIHTAGHVTGGVTPSHEWTEGLLDFYHFTGKREARDKAVSIADNMLRHLDSPRFKGTGGFAARETGWAMRGLVGAYQETREQKYVDACRVIAEQFLEWKAEWGAFLAPYTSHTKVRVPFMISIAVNALARYYDATGDDRVKPLIVDEMADLLDHCVMPDGRFFYKELPSLNRRAGSSREMEALCHAFRLSGERRFLDQTVRMLDDMARNGFGGGGGGGKTANQDAVIFGGAGPKSFASFYVPFMVAYRTLSDEGVLPE